MNGPSCLCGVYLGASATLGEATARVRLARELQQEAVEDGADAGKALAAVAYAFGGGVLPCAVHSTARWQQS